MYLIDSDYLINFLNGKKEAVEVVSELKTHEIFTSVICVGEVLEGLEASGNEEKRESFERFLDAMQVVEVNREVIEVFAAIRGKLRKKGKLIDNFDLLIAATCLAYDLTLITGNLGHFKRTPELKMLKMNR